MLSLRESMELAGRNCLAMLAPSYGYMPMWNLVMFPDGTASGNIGCVQHNIGRWWDAMLRLEAATGFAIPDDLEAAMVTNLHACFDASNKLDIVVEVPCKDARYPYWADVHSQREVILALAARVRWRADEWAAECGGRMVRALDRYILDDGLFDWDTMKRIAAPAGEAFEVDPRYHQGDAYMVNCTGRLIEALLEFYRVADDDAALQLADRLGKWHFQRSTFADGSDPKLPFPSLHTHSYLCTLRGLLRFGFLTGQHEYVERIAITYHVAVRGMLTETGYVSHNWGGAYMGDSASTGDAAQIALELALHGYSEFFDDVEKYVRARILPGQITQTLNLKPRDDDDTEEMANPDARALGAFGGIHRYHPNAWNFSTTDVTTADLHSLCEVYHSIAELTDQGLRINLHFDCDNERVRIEQEQGDTRRTVKIRPKQPGRLFVRVPRWAPADSVELTSAGKSLPVTMLGDFALVSADAWTDELTLSYSVPERTTTETVGDTTYEFKWRGDHIQSVSPNLNFLPFYPTTPGGEVIDVATIPQSDAETKAVTMPD